jgi:hypothetical protein
MEKTERIMASVVDRIYELLSEHRGEDRKPDPWNPTDLARACGKDATWINKRIGRGPKTPKVPLNTVDLELIANALKVDIAAGEQRTKAGVIRLAICEYLDRRKK